jgi:hypothetical protein
VPRPAPGTGNGPATGPIGGPLTESYTESHTESLTGPITGPLPGSAKSPGPSVEWSVTVPAHEADADLDGLPMRVPQASMAPQLRAARRAEGRTVSVRPPEELSQLMSSMQRGWQQGRQQAEHGEDMWNRKDDHPDARPQK